MKFLLCVTHTRILMCFMLHFRILCMLLAVTVIRDCGRDYDRDCDHDCDPGRDCLCLWLRLWLWLCRVLFFSFPYLFLFEIVLDIQQCVLKHDSCICTSIWCVGLVVLLVTVSQNHWFFHTKAHCNWKVHNLTKTLQQRAAKVLRGVKIARRKTPGADDDATAAAAAQMPPPPPQDAHYLTKTPVAESCKGPKGSEDHTPVACWWAEKLCICVSWANLVFPCCLWVW